MELAEAVKLITNESLASERKSIWADVGCGSGLFTRALAGQLSAGSMIYAIDKNPSIQNFTLQNGVEIKVVIADFIKDPLKLKPLDGILMANSFHYVQEKKPFIQNISALFDGPPQFLFVEYDTERANRWVPYPISFQSINRFFGDLGFRFIEKIEELPSIFNSGRMYSALIRK